MYTTISVKDLIEMRKNEEQETERESIQREKNCFFVSLIARSGVMCYPIKQNVFIVFMEYK